MEQDFGLFSLKRDIESGKSITMPEPIDLEAIFSRVRAAQTAVSLRDLTDEQFHAAVAEWFGGNG
jgi:hypothetical protein